MKPREKLAQRTGVDCRIGSAVASAGSGVGNMASHQERVRRNYTPCERGEHRWLWAYAGEIDITQPQPSDSMEMVDKCADCGVERRSLYKLTITDSPKYGCGWLEPDGRFIHEVRDSKTHEVLDRRVDQL